MKFEQIDAALNKEGFRFIKVGEGLGIAKGNQCHLYQKGISGLAIQTVQVVASPDENNVYPILSMNVPEEVRDLIYKINNGLEAENSIKASI